MPEKSWDSERWRHLFKVTQLVHSEAKIRTRLCDSGVRSSTAGSVSFFNSIIITTVRSGGSRALTMYTAPVSSFVYEALRLGGYNRGGNVTVRKGMSFVQGRTRTC